TSLNFRGVLYNVTDPKRCEYDAGIIDSRIEKRLLTALAPPNSLPKSIRLPDVMLLTGTLKGNMNAIESDLRFGGSYGSASLKGYIRNFKNTESALYDLEFSTVGFEAGKLLKQDTLLGSISLSASAKGTGFNYK